jgi:hypothetical protein
MRTTLLNTVKKTRIEILSDVSDSHFSVFCLHVCVLVGGAFLVSPSRSFFSFCITRGVS